MSFYEIDIGVIGLAGLAHLGISRGQVFLFRNNDGDWTVKKFITLDAAPMTSYQDESGNVYLVTTDSVWIIDKTGSSRIIHKSNLGLVYPNSIIVDDKGTLYIGIRNAVVRLTPSSGNYVEEWLIPHKCKTVFKDMIRFTCTCVEYQ